MSTRVTMPQLGETVTEGTILSWAKQVGDQVAVDEVLVEISTDKVDTEVPSPVAGTVLEILVEEGETVEVGTEICVIGSEGEQPAEPAAETAEPETAPEPAAETAEPEPVPEPKPEEAPEPVSTAPPAGSNGGASTRVTMPQLGETVTEGTILSWAKQVGDQVAVDEVLVEISTDKVDTEVPSPVAGTVLEILVEEGETVEVGTEICVIGSEGEQPAEPAAETAEPAAEAAEPEPSVEPPSAPEQHAAEAPAASERVDDRGRLLSPVVRKLVREHDVDVSRIEGTGVGGRVTRKDVEAFLESREAEPEPAPTPEPAVEPAPAAEPEPAAAPAAEPEPAPAPAAAAEAEEEGVVTEPLPRLRARIAENMVRAKQTAAHVWTSVEVDYERVERVRQAHREEFKRSEGFSLTYLPFIARATIDALGEFEAVNSSLDLEEKTRTFHRAVHLGVAIDLDQGGLVVATLRDADGLRLVGLARGIRRLADKARAGKLDPDDVSGSTFTITNPGPFGSFMSAPIINVPNTGILSTETVAKRPAVISGPDGDDVIAIRHIGYLGLTWDHRAFDGSTAVLFLRRIKENLETWDWEQELG